MTRVSPLKRSFSPIGKASNEKALDRYNKTQTASAYALRRLKSNVSKVIRVHRSSDDAEMDIGCIGENLDTATLLAFCGSGSGYVATWYDQGGNGNHATQSTVANMPRIVNAGVVDRDFDATKANAMYPTFTSASGVTLISNGNFVNTSGWTGVGSGTISVTNNTASVPGNGSIADVTIYQTTNEVTNTTKRYFVRATLRVLGTSCTLLHIRVQGSTGGSSIQVNGVFNPVQSQWYTIAGIVTLDATQTGNMRVACRQSYDDAATANGKVMEVQEVVCVDVTDLGKPTVQAILASDTYLVAPDANSLDFTTNASFSVVHNPNSIGEGNAGRIVSKTWVLNTVATTKLGFGVTSNNSAFDLATMNINTITLDSNANSTVFYKNGVVNVSSTGAALTANSTNLTLFNHATGDRQYDGKCSEIILFSTTLTQSQRQRLGRNQGKYYGITVT